MNPPTIPALIRSIRAFIPRLLPFFFFCQRKLYRTVYCVPSLLGCIIGRLLPRVLLSEKGVSAENIQFAKTDAGKPYFARRLLFFLSVLTLAPASTVVLLVPAGHDGRQSTHRV